MHLTPREIDILRYLATGLSYKKISETKRITEACIHVHAQNIRKKTGIKNTRNQWECAKFLKDNPEIRRRADLPTVPTPRQFQIMELFAAGKSYDQIAATLRIGRETCINQLSAARARAGIVSTHAFSDRTKEIRDYLAQHATPTMADPMFQ